MIRLSWAVWVAFSGATLAAQVDLASNLNKQGLAAASHGDYSRAERLYEESAQKWRELGPAYEAHTAAVLVNLGHTLCDDGRWRAGVAALEEALALNRRSLGSTHIRTVHNLSLLGHAWVLAGDTNHAEPILAEALAVERELYSGDALFGQTLLALSSSRRLQGKLDESLRLADEALNVAIRGEGELSLAAAMAYENAAAVHRLAGRPERALPLFRKARFIYQQTVGSSSPIFASLLTQEGLALLDGGQLTLASQDLLQAVTSLSQLGPACEYRLAIAESSLGLLRFRQKKLAEAERLLSHALSVEERLPTIPVSDMAGTLSVMAQLRKAQRRDSESAELSLRAGALQSVR